MTPFRDVDDVRTQLALTGYLADKGTATAALLCARLERPLLVEGAAGVGKTELAHALARAQGRRLIRLQCYEGIDESRALYEWEYAKQLLYTQILRDRLASIVDAHASLDEAVHALARSGSAFFSEPFLLPRPLLQALRSEDPCVLLIDEIDKADPEFEAFLLELLADFAVTIPELGTLRAVHRPQVVLTSNASRELSDPLRRRCLHLSIAFPDAERELAIVRARLPDVDERLARAVVAAVQLIRTLDVRKLPSISETLDWVRALGVLGRTVVDEETLQATIGVLVKHKDDAALVLEKRAAIVQTSIEALNP